MSKRLRMTPIQLQMLVDILSENPELLVGKITTNFTRTERNNKWQAVATLLNSKGLGPQKTPDQWRKSWADLKCAIRSKAAKIELAGGIDLLSEKLSNLEKRVLQMIGDIGPIETSEGNETKNLTSEYDSSEIMRKPKELVLPTSVTRIVEVPDEDSLEAKVDGDENNDDTDDDNEDDFMCVANDNYEQIFKKDLEETHQNTLKESLYPSAKRRKVSSEDIPDSEPSIVTFQKQLEIQTTVLKEQTSIMKDIAKSLQLIAKALEKR